MSLTRSIFAPLLIALALTSCSKETGSENQGCYFALTSQDEWGNVSELSDQLHVEQVRLATQSKIGPLAFASSSQPSLTSTVGAYQGVINIKFKPAARQRLSVLKTRSNIQQTGVEGVDRVAARLGGDLQFDRLFEYIERHEAKLVRHGLDLWYTVRYPAGRLTLPNVIAAFSDVAELEVVETVKQPMLIDPNPNVIPFKTDGLLAHATRAEKTLPFNDPGLSSQWHYDAGVYETPVSPGGNINLLRAWKKSTGSSNIIVAIIDQGVNPEHPDLHDAMWVNKGEIPGNGIDDDQNGYIDDIYGWNFCDDTPNPGKGVSHGCHVAGTVGAINNNGIGVCGIAGGSGKNDGVRLMTCDILSVKTAPYNADSKAFRYAADNGAVIAQCSWGSTEPNSAQQATKEAILYFIAEAGNATDFPDSPMRGGLVIFSAGNSSGTSAKYYPGAHSEEIPEVISVTATNIRGDRPMYANVGAWVSIAAPGGADTKSDPTGPGVVSCLWDDYGIMSGTSMASPHVAGAAALIIATNPGITALELREKILTSGKRIDDSAPGYSGKMGVGCLNASRHVNINDQAGPGRVTDLAFKFERGVYKLLWTVPNDAGGDRVTGYTMYYSDQPIAPGNLNAIKSMSVDTLMTSGAEFSLDVKHLPGIEIAK